MKQPCLLLFFLSGLSVQTVSATPMQESIVSQSATVIMLGTRCSGVALSRRVVIYAGHCGDEFHSVQIGTHQVELPVAYCRVHRESRILAGTDMGYCLLASPLSISPPRIGFLEGDQRADFFGAGSTLGGLGAIRRFAGTVSRVPGKRYLRAKIPAFGMCPGDSGGPVLVAGALVGLASSSHREHSCNFVETGEVNAYVTPIEEVLLWIAQDARMDE